VELFEAIRREYEFGVGTIKGVAEKLGVHRRTVRQALESALPPERKRADRQRTSLAPAVELIDRILREDLLAPRKQRHTAHRIFLRIQSEVPDCIATERSVRRYVAARRHELGLGDRDTHVPQVYAPGVEAQVDWYEAFVDLDGERTKAQLFAMRSMYSGAAFHIAYPRATQQALLEAHELAFAFFGGVFRTLRYDNLSSAVKRVLRGHERIETERFVAFRSHWRYEAAFCTPNEPQEKGGVEGEVGYFRRNHLVPVPSVHSFAELNERVRAACEADLSRKVGDRVRRSGELMLEERSALLPMAEEGFDLADHLEARVDAKSCVQAKTNWYSTPLRPGMRARVRLLPAVVEVLHEGRVVARHARCYGRQQQVLDLEHYLDVLERKPGALEGARPLEQWRAAGRWPASFDRLWERLRERRGQSGGTRAMIELLQAGKRYGWDRFGRAVEEALEFGCADTAAVLYLLSAGELRRAQAPEVEIGELSRFERPAPSVGGYDALLHGEEVA
jgi:transposase